MDERYPSGETLDAPAYSDYIAEIGRTIKPDIFHPYVLEEEAFDELVNKPSVILKGAIPLAVALYDAGELAHHERCLAIAQSLGNVAEPDIYFATSPGVVIAENIDFIRDRTKHKNSLVFMEADLTDLESEHELRSIAVQNGAKLHVLEHPKLHSEASLNMFELALSVTETGASRPIKSAADHVRAKHSQELENTDVVIKRADELSEAELGDLWGLFSERFTDISDNLPVRLEETEEATRQLMTNPDYLFIYKKGEGSSVSACLFITDNPDSYSWINEDFIRMRQRAAESQDHFKPYVTFIPGIAAARSSKGSSGAGEVLMWLTEVLKETNQPRICVDFECTDVSSRYVPMISMRAARQQPAFTSTSINQIGQKKYYALEL